MLTSFIVGALLSGGITVFVYSQMPSSTLKAIRESDIDPNNTYKFTDPLITLSSSNIESPLYDALEQNIESYIAEQKPDGLLAASVYFRDINESKGFTINPGDTYYPASLYKVPVMMTYYEIAEQDPSILSEQLPYAGVSNLNNMEEVRSPIQLTPGTTYTVEELIEHMIRYSDNNAAQLLLSNLSSSGRYQEYLNLFTSLGISTSTVDEAADSLTVGKYPIFLRTLYNSTFLDRDYSEKALQLLTETDFTAGIESGIPNGVLVAQKFGETTVANEQTDIGKELSNCGIIYYPSHPYILCIMTKGVGDNVKGLESNIAAISRMVYQKMEEIYPS
ncbi:MAG: serine hydrolase [Minisyncoccia bacterium]|jgi:beta-lactamase class A